MRNEVIEPAEKVVTSHDGNANFVACALRRHERPNRVSARRWIDSSGICDDANPALGDSIEHALDGANEIARVTHRRIALHLLLENRHRDFRQIVEHQVVDVPAFDQLPGRIE